MQTKRRDLFTTVRTEGAILPADLLQRITDGDRNLEGLTPEDFHRPGERLNEVINAAWNRLLGSVADVSDGAVQAARGRRGNIRDP